MWIRMGYHLLPKASSRQKIWKRSSTTGGPESKGDKAVEKEKEWIEQVQKRAGLAIAKEIKEGRAKFRFAKGVEATSLKWGSVSPDPLLSSPISQQNDTESRRNSADNHETHLDETAKAGDHRKRPKMTEDLIETDKDFGHKKRGKESSHNELESLAKDDPDRALSGRPLREM